MAENGHAIYRTDEEVINALYETGGNVKQTTQVLGLKDVTSLRQRINADPVLKSALIEAREQSLDLAENIIHNTMKKGKAKDKLETAKWYLARKGRNRGYGDVVTNVNANFNVDLIEKARKIPIEKRLEILEYLDATATNID